MIRYFLTSLVVLTFVGCGGPEKEEDIAPSDVPPVEQEEDVQQQEMTFDPQGSDSGNIAGLSTIHFEYDKARLTTEARDKLQQNADWIKNHPEVTVQIEGHCDERGSIEYNLALGERRAKATKNYLVSMGVDPERLTIISYGEEKPLALGDTEEVYSENRRANFVPLPK